MEVKVGDAVADAVRVGLALSVKEGVQVVVMVGVFVRVAVMQSMDTSSTHMSRP